MCKLTKVELLHAWGKGLLNDNGRDKLIRALLGNDLSDRQKKSLSSGNEPYKKHRKYTKKS